MTPPRVISLSIRDTIRIRAAAADKERETMETLGIFIIFLGLISAEVLAVFDTIEYVALLQQYCKSADILQSFSPL